MQMPADRIRWGDLDLLARAPGAVADVAAWEAMSEHCDVAHDCGAYGYHGRTWHHSVQSFGLKLAHRNYLSVPSLEVYVHFV
jgi:hypothetical protein